MSMHTGIERKETDYSKLKKHKDIINYDKKLKKFVKN